MSASDLWRKVLRGLRHGIKILRTVIKLFELLISIAGIIKADAADITLITAQKEALETLLAKWTTRLENP